MPQPVISFRFPSELASIGEALDAEARRQNRRANELARDLVVQGLTRNGDEKRSQEIEQVRLELSKLHTEVARLRQALVTALGVTLTRGMDDAGTQAVLGQLRKLFEA